MCDGVPTAKPSNNDPRITFTDVRHPTTKKVIYRVIILIGYR